MKSIKPGRAPLLVKDNVDRFDGGRFRSPRFKDFRVTSNGFEVLYYAGLDCTLDDVVYQRQLRLVRAWDEAEAEGVNWFAFVRGWPDEVVWEGTEVQVVLIARFPIGESRMTLDVFRFDRTDEKDAGRLESVPAEKPVVAVDRDGA